ncbi:hypothetical protein [Wolbachia endosymbiont (group B) of Athalia cordata]|uniref:hypothetical protein n=1 Tax=Wolbachia endosymbiont (group B) of Athalia cordata TaxID=2953986 RepID=UPI0022318646|nr:hypothetical protein [Wolbachia endosymbiont (group B) of Athalia cordata]
MSIGRWKWVDGIRGKVLLKNESGGNREKCEKICTRRGRFPDWDCADECERQLLDPSYHGDAGNHVKCLIEDVEGECGLKVIDVNCMTGSQDLPKTYAVSEPRFLPKVKLLESKAEDRHNCHRECEDVFDKWYFAIDKSRCKIKCNKRYPTDDEQCDEVMFVSPDCVNECKSAMSTIHKLSQEHAAEMDTYDSISV